MVITYKDPMQKPNPSSPQDMMWIFDFDQLSISAFPLFVGAAALLLITTTWYNHFKPPTTTKKPPPSPPTLPVIGNLHQLLKGGLIHHTFLSLARRYGDSLMILHMGSLPILVVSSSEAAREIMKTHDMAFASRPYRRVLNKLTYDHKELTVAPYGEEWRQARSLITVHLLTQKKVKSFEGLREKMIGETLSKISHCFLSNKPANLTDLFLSLANDVTCMATFGRTYNDGEIGREFKRILKEITELAGRFYVEEIIPQLSVIDHLRGLDAKNDRVANDLDKFLQGSVDDRLSKRRNNLNPVGEDGMESFIDALLDIQQETHIDTDTIKALLLDAYAGGTDTSSTVLEWTMTELLLNPETLKKVQAEIKTVLNGKKDIAEEDLENMKYLKAVIMEATRLHPPLPILPPREARHDVKVMGYDIAKGTRVYVNVYAIMRDPKVYDQPNLFLPERFLESSVDFVKHNFELLVFGAGRRSCPGRQFGLAIVEKMMANLLYRFDWSLPEGVRAEDLDMGETFGFVDHRTIPLLATGKPVVP